MRNIAVFADNEGSIHDNICSGADIGQSFITLLVL